jgi:MoxR-like ATPase
MRIKNYLNFQKSIRLNEQSESNKPGGFAIVYDESVPGGSKDLADSFLDDLHTEVNSEESKAMLNSLLSSGEAALSNWTSAWEARETSGADKGELRKEGEWYFGKGAWRINSNKALKLGMKPDWMQWEDPLHDEIIENFFPELLNSDLKDTEDEFDLDDISLDDLGLDLPAGVETERELVPIGEGYKMKHLKSIFEQEEFTLGPPENAEDDSVVVTTEDLEDMLEMNYNLQGRYNMMIWGAPGIGKTQVVKSTASKIAKAKGKDSIPVMIVTLSQMNPEDLSGIPILYDARADGQGSEKVLLPGDMEGKVKDGRTVPSWLPGLDDAEEGILFFDEINRADKQMLGSCLTLLLDREAQGGKYKIPSGWRIWAAGNREMDGPVTPLEPAVASRFLGGHMHLVPTLESWFKWIRSESAYAKDIDKKTIDIDGEPQFFVPDEFKEYLKHAESGGSSNKHFDLDGKGIQTEYNRFYKLDKAKVMAGGEGASIGFPTPRNWAAAWNQIYQQFLIQDKYQDQVTPEMYDNPHMKGVAALQLVLLDRRDSNMMQKMLSTIIGSTSATDFMSYVKIYAKHNDKNGSLNEKISNVFKKPKGARPLLNMAKVSVSERYKILALVESRLQNDIDSLTTNELINWTTWCRDLSGEGVCDSGEVASHIRQCGDESSDAGKKVASKLKALFTAILQYKQTGKEKYKEIALKVKPFVDEFKEILTSFNL